MNRRTCHVYSFAPRSTTSIDLAPKFKVKGDQCQTLRRLGRLHQTKGGNPNNHVSASLPPEVLVGSEAPARQVEGYRKQEPWHHVGDRHREYRLSIPSRANCRVNEPRREAPKREREEECCRPHARESRETNHHLWHDRERSSENDGPHAPPFKERLQASQLAPHTVLQQ